MLSLLGGQLEVSLALPEETSCLLEPELIEWKKGLVEASRALCLVCCQNRNVISLIIMQNMDTTVSSCFILARM